MQGLEQFGVQGIPALPQLRVPTHPGRVLQVDADFIAYQTAYEAAGEVKSLQQVQDACMLLLQNYMDALGAESCNVHVTPKESTKGGRAVSAVLKPYQGNRKDRTAPRWLDDARKFLGTLDCADSSGRAMRGFAWLDREADDGIAYMHCAVKDPDCSVVVSGDKDLRMLPGLYCNPLRSLSMQRISAEGGFALDEKKKLTGTGMWWFICQMLTGDTADNISGLPAACGDWATVVTGKPGGKSRPVGPVAAYALLTHLKERWEQHRECPLRGVLQMYRTYGDTHGFTQYDTGEPVSAEVAFVSECRLLWMRRDTAADKNDWLRHVRFFEEMAKNAQEQVGTWGSYQYTARTDQPDP